MSNRRPKLNDPRMKAIRAPRTQPRATLLVQGRVDGRTAYARFIADARQELIADLGGNLTTTQKILVERAAWLRLHIYLFDKQVSDSDRPMTAAERRSYFELNNSLTRTICAVKNEDKPPPN